MSLFSLMSFSWMSKNTNQLKPQTFFGVFARGFAKAPTKRVALIDSAKKAKFLENVQRTQWHLRQKPKVEDQMGKNHQFRQVPVQAEILNFITKHKLGRYKKGRRISRDLLGQEKMKKKNLSALDEVFLEKRFSFLKAVTTTAMFPKIYLPEVSFIGRSNVGKSSLIEALTGKRGQVRVSPKPGCTRTINFFVLDSHLALVDLPGYGFAFASEEQRLGWLDLIGIYLRERKELKRTFLLIDARHGLKPSDLSFMKTLETWSVTYQVVLTKTDLVDPSDLARRCLLVNNEIARSSNAVRPVMMVSEQNESSLNLLRSQIGSVMKRLSVSPSASPSPSPSPSDSPSLSPSTSPLASRSTSRSSSTSFSGKKYQRKTVQLTPTQHQHQHTTSPTLASHLFSQLRITDIGKTRKIGLHGIGQRGVSDREGDIL
eukprot:TRINITY_DN1891_c0_g1_i1.p1 TRINITY_DN1891_c0_g1~~TRINITY_DN1891_c0_g1_i1.p1  ORF type:complete len:429 (-),score=121.32 TRINITY_DN1891_c0_g1_i1:1-1287(-)